MGEPSSNTEIVAALAEEFVERYRKGERPPVSEYADKHPELADEIKDLFPALVMLEGLAPEHDASIVGGEPESPPQTSMVEQLGDYRILREVGRGGMGIVYEAEQVSLGRHVALKVLPQNLLTDDQQKRRFEREAKAAARLHHTNIVPVFGVGEHDGIHYYVMQFIQGLGLHEVLFELQRMQKNAASRTPAAELELPVQRRAEIAAAEVARSLLTGAVHERQFTGAPDSVAAQARLQPTETGVVPSPSVERVSRADTRTGDSSSGRVAHSGSIALPGQSPSEITSSSQAKKLSYWQSVATMGVQVASALQHAHDQGIQHRDIKPSNLLLDMRGTVWVTDFGLAKADDQQNLTHTGDILGTLRYLPPEAFAGKADHRGDVYSLGLSLYEMLALKPAFQERDRNKLIKQVTQEAPPRLDKLIREIPRDLVTIVHKAIERDPDHRYQSGGELAEDLQRFIDDEPIKARRVSVAEHVRRWARHNKGLAASLAALLVVLIASAVGSSVAAFHFNRVAGERESQRIKADAARQEEARQRAQAESAREELARQRDRAERALYAARIALAENALNDDDAIAAGHVLDKCRPVIGSPEHRHWEWYYLRKIANAELSSFRPHDPSVVYAIAVSPDGRFVASAGGGNIFQERAGKNLPGQVIIQDLESGEIAHVLKEHKHRIHALGYSPDGRLIATASLDKTVRIWSTETGRPLRTFSSISNDVHNVAFGHDAKTIAMAGQKNIQVCDAQTGKPIHSFTRDDFVFGLEGKRLFLADAKNKSIRIAEIATSKVLATWHDVDLWGEDKPIWDLFKRLTLSPDGKYLAVLGAGIIQVHVYEVSSGEVVQQLQFGKGIRSVAFSPDGKRIVTGGSDFIVRLWDVATGKQQTVLFGHNHRISAVTFTSDGRRLVSSDFDGCVKTWDPRRNPRHSPIRTKLTHDALADLAFAGNGTTLRMASHGGQIQTWDVVSRKMLSSRKVNVTNKAAWPRVDFDFDADGRRLTAPTRDRKVVGIWNAETGKQLASFEGHKSPVVAVALSADGNRVATASGSEVLLWEVGSGAVIRNFATFGLGPGPLALSRDGRVLAMAGREGVILWDVSTGKKRQVMPLPESSFIRGLAFSPDGARLAAADFGNNAVLVWHPSNGAKLFTLPASRATCCVAFSPDGGRLAAVGYNGDVHLWDALTGQDLLILRPDVPPVNLAGLTPRVAFSPDGAKIAASSYNGTITVWDAEDKPTSKKPQVAQRPSRKTS